MSMEDAKKLQILMQLTNVIVVSGDGQGDTGSADEPKKKNRGTIYMLL